jgi:anthranilate phosphoribosyltransferase
MHEVITALLHGRGEVDTVDLLAWRSLWDRLDDGGLDRAEIAALLSTLTTELPDRDSLSAMVVSLRERRPAVPAWPNAVNIVGTGGGPRTFNISTAAAFVAAAMGVPVVKTGSRAYTGSVGSIDLLERLGVKLTKSVDDTAAALEKYGIAFAGPFVYPAALSKMARSLVPLAMRPFGKFLNALGPFLATVPVVAQVTGVSAAAPLARLRELSDSVDDRRIWLCANDFGADELLGFAHNVIHPNDGTGPIRLSPGVLAHGAGAMKDLVEMSTPDGLVSHFLDVVTGSAHPAATEAICLNAAALAVAGGHTEHWPDAYAAAENAVRDGAARALVDRMRAATAVLRG